MYLGLHTLKARLATTSWVRTRVPILSVALTLKEQLNDSRPSPRQPVASPLTNESPASLNSTSVATSYRPRPNPRLIPFEEREAELTRNFSENMALWVDLPTECVVLTADDRQADITDTKRHFELEVTRRACFNPVIRYAICVFSSRHMNRSEGGDLSESLHYHNKCLELLIPILSNFGSRINGRHSCGCCHLTAGRGNGGPGQLFSSPGHNTNPQPGLLNLLRRWPRRSNSLAVRTAGDLCISCTSATASDTSGKFRALFFLQKKRRSRLGK